MKLDEEAYIKEKSIRFVALTYLIPNKQHGDEIGAKNPYKWDEIEE